MTNSPGNARSSDISAAIELTPVEPVAGNVTGVGCAVADPAYFTFARPELLELIPPHARRILEIGCGEGRLGAALKSRQKCQVVGVECDLLAAAQARFRLDEVLQADIEQTRLDFGHGLFDCIVLGDVLEHLRDPAATLRRLRPWLDPQGLLVASVPNVRHHTVVTSLLEGNWTYEPAGLLDRTHLRFFTRATFLRMLVECGFGVRQLRAVPGPGYEEWQQAGRPADVRLGRLQIGGLDARDAEEFFVYQWLVAASPMRSVSDHGDEGGAWCMPGGAQVTRPERTLPRVRVLMVTFNRLDYTRPALESVLAQDYPDWELVVWDNASADGTLEYLRERLRNVPHAHVVVSPVNRGVVYPMNEVWFADRNAPLLAKVDNDTLVPPDLLRRLAQCHLQSGRLGVVSGFHFRVEGEALADDSRIHAFDGVRILPRPFVGGCAVMARREVLDRLGRIPYRPSPDGRSAFMDYGWTVYQQQVGEAGFVNGYPWPPIHVDHMEDVRSPHCIRTPQHEQYKQELRGMSLEEFTREMCVWRPMWEESAAPTTPAMWNG